MQKIVVSFYGWCGSFVSVRYGELSANYYGVTRREAARLFKEKYALFGVGVRYC